MAPDPDSPSASSALLPFLGPSRSRRGSLASIKSLKEVDRDVLAQALDHIHTTASRSETLTSFHDFDGGGRGGAKELVSSGVSGLYNRLKQSVGGGTPVRDGKTRPRSSGSKPAEDIPSPNSALLATRTTPALGSTKLIADNASASTASVAASPVATNFHEAIPSPDQRSQGVNGRPLSVSQASSLERQHEISVKDYENTRADPASERTNELQEERLSQTDVEWARRALLNDDRGDSATQALARVLSHHETQHGDRPQQPRNLHIGWAADQMGSDGSVAGGATRAMPDAHTAVANGGGELRRDVTADGSPAGRRPPMTHVGPSRLPGFEPSRASSTTEGGDVASTVSTHTGRSRPVLDPSPNLNSAMQRRRTGLKQPPNGAQTSAHPVAHVTHRLKRRVISKEFWMKDENAKDCFYCGQSFSTFRRKHHCRTCGQIFDAKCTSLVPGRPFGQPGTLRLCKPCEAIIYGSDDDDSTVFSDDGEGDRSPRMRSSVAFDEDVSGNVDGSAFSRTDTGEVATPSIGIPVSRRNREAKRRSAVIEFNAQPMLARPSSSHSLISLARRPRSSSHRRQQSRHQNLRGSRAGADERGPFHQDLAGDPEKKATLPAFHNDNIIDPDLAPFMSDDGSDGEDQPNILSALEVGASPGERERLGFGGLFVSAMKKGRSRFGDRHTVSSVRGIKEEDDLTLATKHLPKLNRKRNPSMSSITMGRPSPRRSRSNLLLKTIENDVVPDRPATPVAAQEHCTKFVRSSAMHGADAPPVEINRASLEHVRRLLNQLLVDGKVEHAAAWEKALLPILLQCTDDVEPDVQRGDDMDIRHYIKLKKVPGGKPGDTSYVSGVVFSKNVALKSMARSIRNPCIAIVTFAIEYARHQTHFMSLEPVIAQEREYLHNLVGRIAALKPQILLVQRNVSGLALRLLEQAGITVAFNIKESVLAAVARMTQTTMIKSVDKLTMDPSHLGRCASFEVKTYLSTGMRKTYIYLSGCEADLGCTIVLRGGDMKALRQIKRITEFMCYVVYNLKLETTLMRDMWVAVSPTVPDKLEAHDGPQRKIIPLSSTMPHLVKAHSDSDTPSQYEELEKWCKSRILSASPFVVFMQPYLLTQLREQEQKLTTFKKLRDQYAAADEEGDQEKPEGDDRFAIVRPEMVNSPASKDEPKAVREYLHAVHQAQYEKSMHTYETQKRLWESFSSANANAFDPYSHQTIIVLHSTVSSITSAPCTGPELLGIGFYAGYNRAEANFEEDCTLGQYVEDMCMGSASTCKECGKKMREHHRQYVHGYGQLTVSVQRYPSRLRGLDQTMLMWSSCRLCRAETPVVPISDNTWKYSFAKYLELSFWSSPLHPRADICGHDIHKDFLRCFGFHDMVVRIQYEPIEIYDVVVPRATITWRVEADLTVKNEQYSHFLQRLTAFVDSVRKRLDSINVDTLDEKKLTEAHDKLVILRARIEDDHTELLQKLQTKYSSSRYHELIPLNRALRFMDEKAIAWDEDFNNFERDYFPSETDIRKLATLQLRNMFLESQPSSSSLASDSSDTEEGTELAPMRTKTGEQRLEPTEMLSEKANDVLTSTALEHRSSRDEGSEEVKQPAGPGVDNEKLGTSLSRQLSPREDQVLAVGREDVNHLDLAVPLVSPDEASTESHRESSEESKQSTRPTTREGTDDEPFATQPKPLGSGLLERIEQIRSDRAAGIGEPAEPVESKIPRLADLRRRDISPGPVPPLLRAQSQPVQVPRRGAELSPEHSIDAVANGSIVAELAPTDKRLSERLGVARLTNKVSKVTPSLIPRSVPQKSDEQNSSSVSSSVSALAKHFEQMSREFEKERLKERRQRALRSRQARANPLASSRPVVEVYRNATDAVGEGAIEDYVQEQPQQIDDPTSAPMEHLPAPVPKGDLEEVQDSTSDPPPTEPSASADILAHNPNDFADHHQHGISIDLTRTRTREVSDPNSGMSSSTLMSPASAPDMELPSSELSIPEHRKNVWFKYLAEFWSKRSASGWANLEYPLHGTEHVFEDSDIIVREDEPSSVIALSLACADYTSKVKDFRSHPSKQARKHAHTISQASNSFVQDEQQKAIEDSLLSDTGTHMKYSFAHGSVKASCKIFYAESFDALRRRCGVADRFVESVSRCLKFDSKGGKTKSLFLKTLDDRFIIKSLQEVELKAFTKFAPDYFAFMSYTLFHGVPSVIAKMFGLFHVTVKNPATGMDFAYYLLVMENLFYERQPNRRFDLKGSMRNRKIESTGQPDEVLLDENLVETIFESPLFVREHARKLLQASVWNDTMWLCKQNVMDYSLMAGFDDAGKELVVGIIDCIRTYTWDKKLESWIKDRGKNKPTITSPRDYRNRFRVSMMQYVLQAPNCWHQFQAQMVPPKTLKEREDREETEDTEAERYDGRKSDGQ
ncbi:Mitochondrial distribution and morphology protein 12 [Teratosphaeriaceae sp. CCFEE 6253]|nr:Mitochondrial distribution and morphology protein 12 [Teratosphaeriaceae sp. CCFEE 6253]